MAIHTNGCGQYSPPKTSPWPMPQYSERQRTCSQFQAFPTGVAAIPRMAMNTYSSKAFTMPHVQSTPLSSRSPSVASWCSFDTDYDEGLIIEEIKSDEEQLSDSDVEVLVGEYEDPPSDDEDYWERQRYRQQLNEVQEVILCGFEELSTASTPNSPASDTPHLAYRQRYPKTRHHPSNTRFHYQRIYNGRIDHFYFHSYSIRNCLITLICLSRFFKRKKRKSSYFSCYIYFDLFVLFYLNIDLRVLLCTS
ncbi:hypothetical protein BDZ91DRAFT_387235 [Kalaharituber pfeilii]|nr:hypothetical protein BDZ91DRAFT_387235 [Kalaharituber pfeilii]